MAKKVVGVYDNQTELIEAIEEYKNNGYAVQDFSIIGDTNDVTTALEGRTGVTTENIGTDTDDRKEGGFWQSLMTAFDGDRNLGGNEPSVSDRLVGAGLTDDAAREYEEDVRNGRIILLAETAASGFDAEETGYVTDTSVTGTGVQGNYETDNYDRNDLDMDRNNLDRDRYNNDEQRLELREEQLDVSKDRVEAGEVEVHKEVVEEQQKVNIPVTREEVYVERRDVNEAASGTDAAIDEDDDTIRVPIMEEKVEVSKKPVVSEELVIGKREVTDTEQVVESVKHEEANLEADDDRFVNEADRDRDRDSLRNSSDLERDGFNNPSGAYRDGYKDK